MNSTKVNFSYRLLKIQIRPSILATDQLLRLLFKNDLIQISAVTIQKWLLFPNQTHPNLTQLEPD